MKSSLTRPPSPDRVRKRSSAGRNEVPEPTLAELHISAIHAMDRLSNALRRTTPLHMLCKASLRTPTSLRGPVRFWRAWMAGDIDLPYITCSFAQAYAAYRTFAERSGELPCTRGVFTHEVILSSDAAGHPVRGKVMRIGTYPTQTLERMLLVEDPPEASQGAWATTCRGKFEKALAVYQSKQITPRREKRE